MTAQLAFRVVSWPFNSKSSHRRVLKERYHQENNNYETPKRHITVSIANCMSATSTFLDDTNQEICNWRYVQLTHNAWGWSKPSLDTRLLWYPVVSWGSYARKLSFRFGALVGFPKILGGVDLGFACSKLTSMFFFPTGRWKKPKSKETPFTTTSSKARG